MLLQKLCEYADRIDLPPRMYQKTRVKWLIDLDSSGGNPRFVQLTGEDETKRSQRGKEMIAPHVGRTVAISAKLLADNGEYVLGLPREGSDPKRVAKCHRQFVHTVSECSSYTDDKSVQAVEKFLTKWSPQNPGTLPEGFDPADVITFRVDGTLPIDIPGIRKFWASYTSRSAETAPVMQCIVCGRRKAVADRMQVKVKGIPDGQTSGTALVSANKSAFESYGLHASLIAPTCPECGERFAKAANSLMADESTHVRVGPLVFIFWTRDPVAFSPVEFLERPDPDQVRALFDSVWKGGAPSEADDTGFYATALSASGGRVVVREWLESTVGTVRINLAKWFLRQRLVDSYGDSHRPIGVYPLAASLYHDARRDMTPNVPAALIRSALLARALPSWLLQKAVLRNRTEQGVSYPRMVLCKMLLNPGHELREEEDAMTSLDFDNSEPAYVCGRLLAELERIQQLAVNPKATIIDRYFGAASAAPGSVFGALLRGAQSHLAKLRKEKPGAHIAIQHSIEEILGKLPGSFPSTLSLSDQAVFSLGYYHQRAADRQAAKRGSARDAGNESEDE